MVIMSKTENAYINQIKHFEKIIFYILFLFLADGNWGTWSSFGACNVTCGNGYQTRSRHCDNPSQLNGRFDCPGNLADFRPCSSGPCTSNIKFLFQD